MKNMMPKLSLPNVFRGWQRGIEQRWQPYYQSLAERERRILLFSAIFLPVLFFIFGIALPLNDTHMSKQKLLQTLQKQVNEAESLALKLHQKGAVQKRGSAISVVDQAARRAGVRKFITRLRPQNGINGKKDLLIQMQSTPYNKTILFFETLSSKGFSLLQVKFQHSKNKGYIHVQAVIE